MNRFLKYLSDNLFDDFLVDWMSKYGLDSIPIFIEAFQKTKQETENNHIKEFEDFVNINCPKEKIKGYNDQEIFKIKQGHIGSLNIIAKKLQSTGGKLDEETKKKKKKKTEGIAESDVLKVIEQIELKLKARLNADRRFPKIVFQNNGVYCECPVCLRLIKVTYRSKNCEIYTVSKHINKCDSEPVKPFETSQNDCTLLFYPDGTKEILEPTLHSFLS